MVGRDQELIFQHGDSLKRNIFHVSFLPVAVQRFVPPPSRLRARLSEQSNCLRYFSERPYTFSLRAGDKGKRSKRPSLAVKKKLVLFFTYGFVVVTTITNNTPLFFLIFFFLWICGRKRTHILFWKVARFFFFFSEVLWRWVRNHGDANMVHKVENQKVAFEPHSNYYRHSHCPSASRQCPIR